MGENTRQHKKSYDELGFTDDYLFCRFRQERLLRKNERFSGLYRRQENKRKPLQTPAKRSREIQVAR